MAFGLGALAGLGQAPVSLPWITLAALFVVFWLFQSRTSARGATVLGWVFGIGYFALTLSWIIEPFLVDIVRHGWMAPFALLLSATGFALFWGAGFGLAFRLSRPGWGRALAWVVSLSLAEALRSYLWTGFPWALIGHVWSAGPRCNGRPGLGPWG